MHKYEATHVGYDDENNALTVAFGGLPDDDNYPTVSLMLQRSTDDKPGIESVYTEWCEQGMSGYGCIQKFDLFRDRGELIFTEEADFYVPEASDDERQRLTELIITFTLSDEKFVELKRQLSEVIFLGCDCFTSRDKA